MKKIARTLIIMCIVFASISVKSYAISSNGGVVNSHLTNVVGELNTNTSIGSWHFSAGYWKFGYNDGTQTLVINDDDIPDYFSGNSKVFNSNLKLTYSLPTEVQDFIYVYGKERLGLSFYIGKSQSVKDDAVSYSLTNDTITVEFRPVLWYKNHNMWSTYNGYVWSYNIKGNYYFPEVWPGYGENYLSVRGGSVGMQVNGPIIASAYKKTPENTMRFGSYTTVLGNDSVVNSANEETPATVWTGGSMGVYFRYPIKITFYDSTINANSSISEYEYVNGSTYWVQAGNEFSINANGWAGNKDSVIRPTQNTIKIDSSQNTQWIDMRKTASSSTIQQSESTGASHVKFNSATSSTDANGKFYTNAKVTVNGDKDLTISSMSRLNNFANGVWDTSKMYKTSEYTPTISVKSDGSAPVIAGGAEKTNWTKGNVKISMSATDGRSGMKSVSIYDNKGSLKASGTNSTSYTVTTEGITTYTLEAYDNVGNRATKNTTVKIDNTAPVITGSDTYGWSKGTVNISQSAIDSYSGMASMELYNSSGTKVATGTSSISYNVTTEGITTYTLKAYDNAGNMSSKTITVKIDNTAPTALSYGVVDRQDDTFTIEIVGVTDNGGSGVKSQQIKVWVDTPTGRREKIYTPLAISANKSRVVVNRLDFTNVTKTYYYELTLVDNVNNSRTYAADTATMIQNNLTANRVDIYDPREKRYVSQVVSGLQYEGVLEVKNTGEREITKSFDIGFKINGVVSSVITENEGINKDEVKEYRFTFVAGEENLLGVLYEGIADYNDVIYETNETDNSQITENPYTTPRSDNNPPIIPPISPEGEKIANPVPIITIKLDLVAEYIDIVDLNSEEVMNEIFTDDTYRFKYKIKNNSSLSFKYIDIANKTFSSNIFYDENLIDTISIDDMSKDETKTFYKTYKIPLLPDDIIETIKSIRLDVDINNDIKEIDETNNSISKNKKVIGLKLVDYRIIDVVNPIEALSYPIYTTAMPLNVKAGYNVTFKVNVIGKADSVYVNIKDSNGKDYGKVSLVKERDIDNVRSEWTYVFAPDIDTKDNTIIITNLYATKNSLVYNYNLKESWNGETLKIGGDAREDIIIYRKY